MKILLPAVFFAASLAAAGVVSFPVVPSATDPGIKNFDTPHWVYVDPDVVSNSAPVAGGTPPATQPRDRHELLLWLPGTGGTGHGAQGFANLSAGLGYHVISLMYPDDVPASVCANDLDTKAFEEFRLAIIEGGYAMYRNGGADILVPRADSIENRLIKALVYLQKKRPAENWAQFLNKDGTIRWECVAVAGQSQGGGHAALIGIKHKVARILCFGSPKDYCKLRDEPAVWYGLPSATPRDRFFAFNHLKDPIGCTPGQLLENLKLLKSDTFGTPVEVNAVPFPYRHARILYTDYPEVTVTDPASDAAKAAHGAAIGTKNSERWKPVWTYMLTEPTSR